MKTKFNWLRDVRLWILFSVLLEVEWGIFLLFLFCFHLIWQTWCFFITLCSSAPSRLTDGRRGVMPSTQQQHQQLSQIAESPTRTEATSSTSTASSWSEVLRRSSSTLIFGRFGGQVSFWFDCCGRLDMCCYWISNKHSLNEHCKQWFWLLCIKYCFHQCHTFPATELTINVEQGVRMNKIQKWLSILISAAPPVGM